MNNQTSETFKQRQITCYYCGLLVISQQFHRSMMKFTPANNFVNIQYVVLLYIYYLIKKKKKKSTNNVPFLFEINNNNK